MDIEGAEYEVIYNSQNTLNKIKQIFMECHNLSKINESYCLEGMKKFLFNRGFKILSDRDNIITAQK